MKTKLALTVTLGATTLMVVGCSAPAVPDNNTTLKGAVTIVYNDIKGNHLDDICNWQSPSSQQSIDKLENTQDCGEAWKQWLPHNVADQQYRGIKGDLVITQSNLDNESALEKYSPITVEPQLNVSNAKSEDVKHWVVFNGDSGFSSEIVTLTFTYHSKVWLISTNFAGTRQ